MNLCHKQKCFIKFSLNKENINIMQNLIKINTKTILPFQYLIFIIFQIIISLQSIYICFCYYLGAFILGSNFITKNVHKYLFFQWCLKMIHLCWWFTTSIPFIRNHNYDYCHMNVLWKLFFSNNLLPPTCGNMEASVLLPINIITIYIN